MLIKESFADYRKRIERFNASTGKKRLAGESWASIKWGIDNPRESTPAMLKGTIIHALLFEADTFNDDFAVSPSVDRRTKAGKETWAAFCAENEGKLVISQDLFDECSLIIESTLKNDKVRNIIESCDETESTGLWTDKTTGVDCRARFDGFSFSAYRAPIDAKTTNDITDRGIARAMEKFFYFEQAAHYLEGAKHMNLPCERMLFVFISTNPPYESRLVAVFREELGQSIKAMQRIMFEYGHCIKFNDWPEYDNSIMHLKRRDFSALTI